MFAARHLFALGKPRSQGRPEAVRIAAGRRENSGRLAFLGTSEALEKALGDRKTNKDKIVDRRRRELLGEKVDEDW